MCLQQARTREEKFAVWYVDAAHVSELLLEVVDARLWARSQHADIALLLETYDEQVVCDRALAFIRAVATKRLPGPPSLSIARLRKVWDFAELVPMVPPERVHDDLDARLRAAEGV